MERGWAWLSLLTCKIIFLRVSDGTVLIVYVVVAGTSRLSLHGFKIAVKQLNVSPPRL